MSSKESTAPFQGCVTVLVLLLLPLMLLSGSSPTATLTAMNTAAHQATARHVPKTQSTANANTPPSANSWSSIDTRSFTLNTNYATLDALKSAKLPVIRFDTAVNPPTLPSPSVAAGIDISGSHQVQIQSMLAANATAIALDETTFVSLATPAVSNSAAVYSDLRNNQPGTAIAATTTDGSTGGATGGGPTTISGNPTGVGGTGDPTTGGDGGTTIMPEPIAVWPIVLLALPLARRSRRATSR